MKSFHSSSSGPFLGVLFLFVGIIGRVHGKPNELSLPAHEVEIFYEAAELSSVVYFSDLVSNPSKYITSHQERTSYKLDSLQAFKHEPDQSLVARRDNVCYGVFRGTDVDNLTYKDAVKQNIYPGTRRIEGCTVRKGFHEGLANPYRPQFDAALKGCMDVCQKENGNGECTMVLSGHSQGGAIAAVASIVYKSYNPMVVTFGAPKAVHAPCSHVNPHRHYRFINVHNVKLGKLYDCVTMLTGFGADHFGKTILLDKSPAYLGINDEKDRHLYGVSPHFLAGYVEKTKKLRDQTQKSRSKGLIVGRLGNGENCGYGDECSSGRCEGWTPPYKCRPKLKTLSKCNEGSDCLSGKCRLRSTQMVCALPNGKMPNGGPCDIGSHCVSGRCEGWVPPFRCRAKLKVLSSCNENSDCESGRCLLRSIKRVCANPNGKMPNGGPCGKGSHCESGRCEGSFPPYRCRERLNRGAKCNENSDCKSGRCRWRKCK